MISFACPGCSAVFSTTDDKAGKNGKCPKCSMEFIIPDATPENAPQAEAESGTVEISPCPGCQAQLSVATGDLGLDIECPSCKTVYKARALNGLSTRPTAQSNRPTNKRRRFDDDEDDDDYDRRRRKRRYAEHRGTLILVLGILSLFFFGFILGPIAWFMGGNDLREMDSGRMDPSGRGLTQAGRITGLIAAILHALVVLFYCVIVIVIIAAAGRQVGPPGGANGPGGAKNPFGVPPRAGK